MKQGQALTRVVMFLFLGAIVAYLGVYTYRGLSDPLATTYAYEYTVDDTLEATGYLVRAESVLPVRSRIADVLPAEGEKVARGETVAYLYRDAAALERRNQLRTLTMQVEQLEYALGWAGDERDSAKLSEAIIDGIIAIHASTARRELTDIPEAALELKSLIYQRDYTYGGGDLSAVQGDIDALNAQILSLQAVAAEDTTVVTAETPGIFSGVVDGYEGSLTPQALESMTPSALDALTSSGQADETAIGKLITDFTWYFACALPEEQARRLVEGERVDVRFSRDWSGEVSMKVERLSRPEDGRILAVLSAGRQLAETTLLRRQTVELVFESKTGLRVPKEAVRMEEWTVRDESSGEDVRREVTGVYGVVGGQAEFKPVTILAEEEEFFLVESAPFRNPDNSNERKKVLRSGDEIVVRAEDLYDGKVLRTG